MATFRPGIEPALTRREPASEGTTGRRRTPDDGPCSLLRPAALLPHRDTLSASERDGAPAAGADTPLQDDEPEYGEGLTLRSRRDRCKCWGGDAVVPTRPASEVEVANCAVDAHHHGMGSRAVSSSRYVTSRHTPGLHKKVRRSSEKFREVSGSSEKFREVLGLKGLGAKTDAVGKQL